MHNCMWFLESLLTFHLVEEKDERAKGTIVLGERMTIKTEVPLMTVEKFGKCNCASKMVVIQTNEQDRFHVAYGEAFP